jgi:hypothetical protein
MTVPVESSEIQDFTPESLKNLGDAAPKFRFRAVTERHVRRYRALCVDDGLTYNTDSTLFAEQIEAVETLWSSETAQPMISKMRLIAENAKQDIPNSDDDAKWSKALAEQLMENWPRLRVMKRQNIEFMEYSPRYALSAFLQGWKGIDVPFRLDAGFVPVDDIPKIGRALQKIEESAIADKIEGVGFLHKGETLAGMAYFELGSYALGLTNLDEDEEKN